MFRPSSMGSALLVAASAITLANAHYEYTVSESRQATFFFLAFAHLIYYLRTSSYLSLSPSNS